MRVSVPTVLRAPSPFGEVLVYGLDLDHVSVPLDGGGRCDSALINWSVTMTVQSNPRAMGMLSVGPSCLRGNWRASNEK